MCNAKLMERTVGEWMSPDPVTVRAGTDVARAKRLMEQHRIRHLPVVGPEGVAGIVSSRDLQIVLSLKGVDPADVTVDELMIRKPYCVSPQTSIAEAARTMAKERYGSAVVVDDGRVVGIFTTVDALTALAGA